MMNQKGTNLPARTDPAPLIVWPRVRRTALIIGVSAGELVLFAVIGSGYGWWISEVLPIIAVATVVLGGFGAGVAALVTRRGGPTMSALEADLQHATQLMERRLITEEDYHTLKAKLIQDYRPGVSKRSGVALRAGLWSALVALTVSLFGFAASYGGSPTVVLIVTLAAMGIGAGVGGAASVGMQLLRRRLERPALSAQADRTPLDDPVLRDRPALEG